MKQLTRFEMAAVKRTIQSTQSKFKELEKTNAKIIELAGKRESLKAEIAEWEAPIVNKYGYTSRQLVEMGGIIPDEVAAEEDNPQNGDVDVPAPVLAE